MQTSVRNFLVTGKVEGYSYLLLLFVAMPLKYMFDSPLAVKILGAVHGFLFVVFMYTILVLLLRKGISFKNAAGAFLLSLLPFGTFYLNRLLPRREN